MCDYSLQNVRSRAAEVGDKLTTRHFGVGTRGFSAPEDSNVAVCLLPGTEIAFAEDVVIGAPNALSQTVAHKTAIFRQVDKDQPFRHHDALEFPDGATVLLTHLAEGQSATVLQLPAKPITATEVQEQTRAAFVG